MKKLVGQLNSITNNVLAGKKLAKDLIISRYQLGKKGFILDLKEVKELKKRDNDTRVRVKC